MPNSAVPIPRIFFRFDPQLHLRFDRDPDRNAEIRAERLTPDQIMALEQADEKRMTAYREHCDTPNQTRVLPDRVQPPVPLRRRPRQL